MIHVVQLLMVAVFAFVGYREASTFQRAHGTSPWNLSPTVWAVIAGFSLLLGAILITIAKKTTATAPPARVAAPSAPWPGVLAQAGPGTSASPFGLPSASQPAPAGDYGATFQPSQTILPPS